MDKWTRREFVRLTTFAGAALLGGTASAQLSQRVKLDLSSVDPELRPALCDILNSSQRDPTGAVSVASIRDGAKADTRPPLSSVPFEKRIIPGPRDNANLVVYVVNAGAQSSRAAILHSHGGGFISDSAFGSVAFLQPLAANLGCVIVTVEYRLAPEATYEQSCADVYAGLRWLHANAADLGVEPSLIAVMGESAGGGHAALLALNARDRGEIPLAFQMLVYPMLDDRTGSSRRVPSPMGDFIWTAEYNRLGWRSFLGQEPGTALVPAEAVPARRTDLRGLPPTFIGVGSVDLFAEEDIDYARKLVDAGVPTELLVVPGAFHGFDGIASETSVAKKFTDLKLTALRRALALG